MVDRAKLLQRLMATFLDELDEHVQTLGDGVLALEKGLPDDELTERLAAMFRAAHSLKGAARAVDQEPIEQLCHTLEDVFGAIRDGRMSLEGELCTLILNTADAIGGAGQALRAKEPLHIDLLIEF
nr:Hpt domain-containing protein [Planctomycetota bacterium]